MRDLNQLLQATVATLETKAFEKKELGEAVAQDLKKLTDGRRAEVNAPKFLDAMKVHTSVCRPRATRCRSARTPRARVTTTGASSQWCTWLR